MTAGQSPGAEEPAVAGDFDQGHIVGVLLFIFIPGLRKAKARTQRLVLLDEAMCFPEFFRHQLLYWNREQGQTGQQQPRVQAAPQVPRSILDWLLGQPGGGQQRAA